MEGKQCFFVQSEFFPAAEGNSELGGCAPLGSVVSPPSDGEGSGTCEVACGPYNLGFVLLVIFCGSLGMIRDDKGSVEILKLGFGFVGDF